MMKGGLDIVNEMKEGGPLKDQFGVKATDASAINENLTASAASQQQQSLQDR